MKIILASQNPGKVAEICTYFEGSSIEIIPAPNDLKVVENGNTFLKNSLLKAQAYFEVLKQPILADDSGLCLEAFPEIMGVETANYRSDLKNYSDKCQSLVKLYQDQQEKNYRARFVCQLCLYLGPDEVFFFEGVLTGSISITSQGHGGFGYDPIFIPDGKNETLAEIEDWKKNHSHRAKAAKALKEFLLVK